MSHYAGSVPDTPRPADWRDAGACRGHDRPDMWFASSKRHTEAADAADAKRICGLCPVRRDCLTYALNNRIEFGTFGGYDEDERAELRRKIRKGTTTVRAAVANIPAPAKPRTLRTIFDDGTARIFGGHLEWVGNPRPSLHGHDYTPRQLAFTLDRGYAPTGHVHTECGHQGCVLPAHLTDAAERKQAVPAEEIRLPKWSREAPGCGTREAYQRHRRNGETPCEPCRAANTAADRRLRETGTTKELAR